MEYSKSDIVRLKKYHPACLRGEHVPVAAVDNHFRILEIYCQHCFITMTEEEHRAYFKTSNINYDSPGDPSDIIDVYAAE